VSPRGGWPGFNGISGTLRADPTTGRVNLDSAGATLIWPQVFRATIALDELSGLLIWREGANALTIVTDDLLAATADARARAQLELTLPRGGGSATLYLAASIDQLDAVAAKRYFPIHKMPRRVVDWLDDSIRGGTVRDAEIGFVGPLAAFPFDGGEGTFRVTAEVENGVLAYARDWPRAENLDGEIEVVNASLSARGAGRVLGNAGDDVRVRIDDLRRPVLSIDSRTRGPL